MEGKVSVAIVVVVVIVVVHKREGLTNIYIDIYDRAFPPK